MDVPYIWHPGAVNEAGIKSPDPLGLFAKYGNLSYFSTFVPEREGFYAFKTMEQCQYEYDYYSEYLVVRGLVALWGTVFEHEKGYRGQFAKILALKNMGTTEEAKQPSTRFALDRLREKYGVDA